MARDQRHPRNTPDPLLRKLAAKAACGFELRATSSTTARPSTGARSMRASRSGTLRTYCRGTALTVYELDKLVAPQFPMIPADIPQDIRMTVDDWVGVADRASQPVGEVTRWVAISLAARRGMRDIRDLPMITEALLRRGGPQERIRKFGRQPASSVPPDYGKIAPNLGRRV